MSFLPRAPRLKRSSYNPTLQYSTRAIRCALKPLESITITLYSKLSVRTDRNQSPTPNRPPFHGTPRYRSSQVPLPFDLHLPFHHHTPVERLPNGDFLEIYNHPGRLPLNRAFLSCSPVPSISTSKTLHLGFFVVFRSFLFLIINHSLAEIA